MSKRFRLCVWLVALLPLAGFAGEDFAKGLAQFEKLGLPDVSKAEYVKVVGGDKLRVSDMFFSRYGGPGGNGWLLKETLDKDGKPLEGEFVVNGCQPLALTWGGRRGATWKRANAERDARRALRFVEKGRDDGVFDDEVKGRIFLFALQLRQRGLAAESDLLFAALFQDSPKRGAVVGAALTVLADCQAGELFHAFRRGANWAEYRDGLKALLAKYPTGWSSAPSARNLLSLAERKAASPDSLAAATKDLSPAELELALGLVRASGVRSEERAELEPWPLSAAWKEKSLSGDHELKVRAMGLAALPFLLKLVGDDTLTGVDHGDLYEVAGVLPMRPGTVDELPDFGRPATLGELARFLLQRLLPMRDLGRSYGSEAESVEARAQAFWERRRNDSQERLAMAYLGGGFWRYNPAALKGLLEMARTAPLPLFEKRLLGVQEDEAEEGAGMRFEPEGDLRMDIDAFVPYAAIRGGDGQAFTRKFLARLEVEERDMRLPPNVNYGGEKENATRLEEGKKQVRDWAAKIRETPFAASAETLLADYLAKGSSPGYGLEALRAKLEALGPDQAAGLVLRQAVAAKEPKARWQAAKLLVGMDGLAKPTAHADLWRVLLDDHRPEGNFQVSDYFLNLNERLYAPRLGRAVSLALIGERGDAGRAFMRERVLARLAGTPEKDLPCWKVAPCDISGALRRFAAVKSREEAVRLVATLSVQELEALPKALTSDPALNAKLSVFANTVTDVDCGDDSFRLELLAWKGKAVAPGLLGRLQDYCEARAKAGEAVDCRAERGDGFGGCKLVVKRQGGKPPVGYEGLVLAEGVYGAAHWRLAPEPKKRGWQDFLSSSPYDMEGFKAAEEAFCGTGAPAGSQGLVRFLSKQEAER